MAEVAYIHCDVCGQEIEAASWEKHVKQEEDRKIKEETDKRLKDVEDQMPT